MDTRRKWMGTTLVATLLLGIGLGILADRFVLLPTVASRTDLGRSAEGESHEGRWSRFRERLERELDLSAGQREQLEEVLRANHDVAERFWEESRREYDDLRMTFRQAIRDVLTEEQRARFDRMLVEYDEARKRRDRR